MQQCCMSQGPITLKAQFDKDTCTSDDTLLATVEVDMTGVKKGRLTANRAPNRGSGDKESDVENESWSDKILLA